MKNIYLSGEANGSMAKQMGAAHYSYRFVEEGYAKALKHAGFKPHVIDSPEFYSRVTDLPGGGNSNEPVIHICLRSTENIRLCRPAYNIGMFAWEFDVLRTDELNGDSPFDKQIRMLSILDEVWTLCEYSKTILMRNGLKNVRVVPTPISFLKTSDDIQENERYHLSQIAYRRIFPLCCNTLLPTDRDSNKVQESALHKSSELINATAKRQLFISVLNPNDMRKNLGALLLGFHSASKLYPDAVLLIKLNLPLGTSAQEALNAVVGKLPYPTSIFTKKIIFMIGFLDDSELNHFYRAATYYLTATFAEGQNLPLQESMLCGCVAISPKHTAMLDYLNEENSISVQSAPTHIYAQNVGGNHARKEFEVQRSRAIDIARSIKIALDETRSNLLEIANAGVKSITANYSIEKISRKMGKIVDEIEKKLKTHDQKTEEKNENLS